MFSAWGYLFFAETVAPSLFAEEGEYVVVLKEDGFHPDDISIKKGDTVTFISVPLYCARAQIESDRDSDHLGRQSGEQGAYGK